MGYIAGIASLVGGLVSAGSSIYGDIAGQSGASQANRIAGEEAGTIKRARQIYIDPYTNANYWNLNLPAMLQQSIQTGEQWAPQLNQFNQGQLTNLLNQAVPGYQGMMNQMGRNVASELAGNVPLDVQNQIQRFGAAQTISSGIGGGGGAGAAGAPFGLTDKTITARDLGLTSLSLTQQGQQGLNQLLGMARNYTMAQPVNPMSLLPLSDLVTAQQWQDQAQFQANLAGFTAMVDQAAAQAGQVPNQSVLGGISGIGGVLQGLGQTNPQTGQSGFGMLGSLLGGISSGSLFSGGASGGNYIGNTGALFGSSPGAGMSGFMY